jgi:hypothetical protein
MLSVTMPKGRRKDPKSKRSLGTDRHVKPRVVFHPPRELLDRLDEHVLAVRPSTDRTAVLIEAIEEYLRKQSKKPRIADTDA